MSAQGERDALKAALAAAMRKIPASLASASVQTVRSYKKLVSDSNKAMASFNTSNAKLAELTRAFQSY